MKNLCIYKRALALATSASILLLSGCTKNDNQNINKQKTEKCIHLTVYFENDPITFKECEGFEISAVWSSDNSKLNYMIFKNDEQYISGDTTNYNVFRVVHENIDTYFENDSIKKTK